MTGLGRPMIGKLGHSSVAGVICAVVDALSLYVAARDRGFNQPGAMGSPRADPGINQPPSAT